MSCSRWIAVCADVFIHAALSHGPFDRRSAWLWLIANAAWKSKRVNHKGKPLQLERGQVLAGRRHLAETWGWSEKQVRIFLDLLKSEKMIEGGQSNGHYANIITICNYDRYQTATDRANQSEGQSRASAGPEQGQTFTTSTTSTKEKIPPTPHGAGRDFWAKAINPDAEHGHDKVTLVDGKLTLFNGYHQEWLAEFGGDAKGLDLALKEIAGRVQPSHHARPLEAQVSSQLARMARDKRDRDKRYADAAARNAKAAAPTKPSHMARY
jgi:hypothetical protein